MDLGGREPPMVVLYNGTTRFKPCTTVGIGNLAHNNQYFIFIDMKK